MNRLKISNWIVQLFWQLCLWDKLIRNKVLSASNCSFLVRQYDNNGWQTLAGDRNQKITLNSKCYSDNDFYSQKISAHDKLKCDFIIHLSDFEGLREWIVFWIGLVSLLVFIFSLCTLPKVINQHNLLLEVLHHYWRYLIKDYILGF